MGQQTLSGSGAQKITQEKRMKRQSEVSESISIKTDIDVVEESVVESHHSANLETTTTSTTTSTSTTT